MTHDGSRPVIHDVMAAADSGPGKARPVAYQHGQQHPDDAGEPQDDANGMQIEAAYVSALQCERQDRAEDDEGNAGWNAHDTSPLSGGWIVSSGMSGMVSPVRPTA